MNKPSDNPYARLERIFHEPGRLTIMTSLLGAPKGMTFTKLKAACDLTDGNLSRHLKALAQAKAIHISKRFAGNRPQTTISLSRQGRDDFLAYLQALEAVLLDAAEKNAAREGKPIPATTLFGARLAKT